MKNLYPLVFAAVLAACAGARSRPVVPPTEPAAGARAEALAPLPELATLKMPCLGYAMHALYPTDASATAEERAKTEAQNYAYVFEDAQHEKEYVECLEKDPGSDDYRKYHADAVRYLKGAQDSRDRYAAALPEGKRIASVTTTFSDVDAKRGRAATKVTLNDGSSAVTVTEFEKMNP
ncbi:MAG: hypothetical protein HY079_07155 [Elusimicrobia bacterium]|nr:hypothetical protein [Elusimicrobiota bacterium]